MHTNKHKYLYALSATAVALVPVNAITANAETGEYEDSMTVNSLTEEGATSEETNSVDTGTTGGTGEVETTTPPPTPTTPEPTGPQDVSDKNSAELSTFITSLPHGSEFIYKDIRYVKMASGLVTVGSKVPSITTLTIPDTIGSAPVISIADRAFQSVSINSLTVGGNVTTIGSYAFSNSAIRSVTLGNGLLNIGEKAFEGNAFSSLTIPNSVTTLGKNAFSNGALTSLTLGIGLRSIPAYAFANNYLTVLQVPPNVTIIDEFAFTSNQINSLTVRQGLTSIGKMAFSNNQIANVYVPSTVHVLGEYVFYNNPVKTVTMPERLKSYITQITSNPASLTALNYFEDSKDPGTGITAPVTGGTTGNKVTDTNVLSMAIKTGSFGVVRPNFTGNSFGTFELAKSELQKKIGFASDVFVVDTTGTGKGWSLSVEASPFTEVQPTGGGKAPKGGWLKLPEGSLKLTGVGSPYRVNVDGTTQQVSDGVKVTANESVIDKGPIKLLTADATSSFGTYGLDLSKANLILNLDPSTVLVDNENYPNGPTPYTTTITWTLTAGPGN